MLHSTAVMRLFILLILTVHTDCAIPEQNNQKEITMDLYFNSIDDDFMECRETMYCVATKQLLKNELSSNRDFRIEWNDARKNLGLGNTPDSELTETNMTNIALQAYTRPRIYRELNNKMREGRETYMSRFGLISLHFLMTYGIQIRNTEQCSEHGCRTTYRRIKIKMKTDPVVRFGNFASSSVFPNQTKFGSETCFIITTCYGVDISDIALLPQEGEVLIPPYEVFKSELLTGENIFTLSCPQSSLTFYPNLLILPTSPAFLPFLSSSPDSQFLNVNQARLCIQGTGDRLMAKLCLCMILCMHTNKPQVIKPDLAVLLKEAGAEEFPEGNQL
ncbi:hypothetical protein MHYP_G00129830 [Metynnis hypsauchen]